jgi:ABC-2 type transport system permease protein
VKGGGRLGEQLYTMINVLAMTPQNTQGRFMKVALFSILPAGFIVILPVEIVRDRAIQWFAVLVPAIAIYWVLAVCVFQRGLRRYTSATGWTA